MTKLAETNVMVSHRFCVCVVLRMTCVGLDTLSGGMSYRSLSGRRGLEAITYHYHNISDHDDDEMNNLPISIALNRG